MPTSNDSGRQVSPTLRGAFEALVAVLNERGTRYAIVGGIAMIQHSRARATDDIDALVAVPQVLMPGLFEALGERGFTVDLARNIRELRDEGMTSVRYEGVIVDFLGPMIPAYAHALDRAVETDVLGQRVRVASAEGLIVTKLIAMRPQDEADIRDLLAAYEGRLDLGYIRAELASFTKADDPRRAKFEAWVRGE